MPRVYPPLESRQPILTLTPSLVESTAGFTAGVVSTLVVHPFDVVKTRIQIEQNAKSRIGTTWRVVRQIANEGWHEGYRGHGTIKDSAQVVRSFYRGLMPNMVGNSFSWGMYFMWYGNVKDLIASTRGLHGKDKENLSSTDFLLAAGASGVLTACVTNPIWVIKTRMLSTARNTPGAYTSSLQGVRSLWKTEGLRGFYRGLTPSLLGVSHGAVQFMAYEKLKIHWGQSRAGGKEGLTNSDFLQLSAVSKMFAGSITYPYQVVRSRLQTYDAQTKYKGVRDVIKQVWKYEGLSGFYKGYVWPFRWSEMLLTHGNPQTWTQPHQGRAIDLRNLPRLREREEVLATYA
jgi:solute carrier family 25 folate transporter 32